MRINEILEFQEQDALGDKVIIWTHPHYKGTDLDEHYWEKKPKTEVPTNKLTSNEPGKEKQPKAQPTIQYFTKQFQSGKDPTMQKPILVTPKGSGYLVLDGNHRYFGAKVAGAETVNVVVIPSRLSFYIRVCFQYKNSGSFMYNDKQTMIIPTRKGWVQDF